MKRLSLMIFAVLFLTNCNGYFSATSPEAMEGIRVRSNLGFIVQAAENYRDPGEGATRAHADKLDQYWAELMICLRDEMGFTNSADPNSIPNRGTTILLHQPRQFEEYRNPDLIYCERKSGGPWVGCYSDNFIEIPGNFLTTTLMTNPEGPLKHEGVHYFLDKTRGVNGMKGKVHFYSTPNSPDQNIWWCASSQYKNATEAGMTYEQFLQLNGIQ